MAARGQVDAAHAAHEQLGVQRGFEFADRMRDGGLRDAELARGGAQASCDARRRRTRGAARCSGGCGCGSSIGSRLAAARWRGGVDAGIDRVARGWLRLLAVTSSRPVIHPFEPATGTSTLPREPRVSRERVFLARGPPVSAEMRHSSSWVVWRIVRVIRPLSHSAPVP
jgi:hypothetical protein